MTRANEVWSIDFKGQFRTGDGGWCYPLTVMDSWSRYLLGCHALMAPRRELVQPVMVRLFREYGLPDRIRSDNGPPFASGGLGRLSVLSVWWIRLGIVPELITPGQPQQNGRHERMHKTLKAETAMPPAASRATPHRRFGQFARAYNAERPHDALGQATPMTWYQRSRREFPARLPVMQHPAPFEVRRVVRAASSNGDRRRFMSRKPSVAKTSSRGGGGWRMGGLFRPASVGHLRRTRRSRAA